MYGHLHTNAQQKKNLLNVVVEDASKSHREHKRYPQVTCNLCPYNERIVYCRTSLQVPVSAHRHSLPYLQVPVSALCTQTISSLFTGTCICTQTVSPLFTGTCISMQTLPDLRNFKLGNFWRTQFLKQKKNNIFEKDGDFFLDGMRAQWDERSGRILLGDKTGDRAVMLRRMKFQCVEDKLNSCIYMQSWPTICMLRHTSDFPNSELLPKSGSDCCLLANKFPDFKP